MNINFNGFIPYVGGSNNPFNFNAGPIPLGGLDFGDFIGFQNAFAMWNKLDLLKSAPQRPDGFQEAAKYLDNLKKEFETEQADFIKTETDELNEDKADFFAKNHYKTENGKVVIENGKPVVLAGAENDDQKTARKTYEKDTKKALNDELKKKRTEKIEEFKSSHGLDKNANVFACGDQKIIDEYKKLLYDNNGGLKIIEDEYNKKIDLSQYPPGMSVRVEAFCNNVIERRNSFEKDYKGNNAKNANGEYIQEDNPYNIVYGYNEKIAAWTSAMKGKTESFMKMFDPDSVSLKKLMEMFGGVI